MDREPRRRSARSASCSSSAAVANDFLLIQIVGWTLILGMIALSPDVLAGYGGMVSLAQMTVAGVAGYMIAVLGVERLPRSACSGRGGWRRRWRSRSLSLFGTIVGALSARTEGIYTIMITLALAARSST